MTRLLFALMLLWAAPVVAQGTTGAGTGHWEGLIAAPMGEIPIELDLAFGPGGHLIGTFSHPGEGLTGFPLSAVVVDGRSVTLAIVANRGTRTFRGTLTDDGSRMSGDFQIGIYAVPFSVTRTGEARIAPVPRSNRIDTALDGSWQGTLRFGLEVLPVLVTLTNHADGTATGTWSTDGGAAVPLTITSEGSRVTLASPAAPGVYSGVLVGGRSIQGTFSSRGASVPLTLSPGAEPGR